MKLLSVILFCIANTLFSQNYNDFWYNQIGKFDMFFDNITDSFSIKEKSLYPSDSFNGNWFNHNYNYSYVPSSASSESGEPLLFFQETRLYNGKYELIFDLDPTEDFNTFEDYAYRSLFVPHPANNNLYYLFLSGVEKSSSNIDRFVLMYLLIDATGNGGKGAIVKKDYLFNDKGFGTFIATKHKDYYYMVFKNDSLNKLYTYKIDNAGINKTPIDSLSIESQYFKEYSIFGNKSGVPDITINNPIWSGLDKSDYEYQIRFNPQGTQFCYIQRHFILDTGQWVQEKLNSKVLHFFNFNPETGKITKEIFELPLLKEINYTDHFDYFEYSPTGKYLFFGRDWTSQSKIYRFAIDSLQNPTYAIFDDTKAFDTFSCFGLALGPNCKLYLLNSRQTGRTQIYWPPLWDYAVYEMSNPEETDSKKIKMKDYVIPLSIDDKGNKMFNSSQFKFPYNMYFKHEPKIVVNEQCLIDTFRFTAIKTHSAYYYWDFGDGGRDTSYVNTTSHFYKNAGNYTVTLIYEEHDSVKTINKTIAVYDLPKLSVSDTLLFNQAGIVINVFDSSIKSYLWDNGDTTSITLINAGKHSVEVKNDYCTTSDSFKVYNVNLAVLINSSCGEDNIPFKFTYTADSVLGFYNGLTFKDTNVSLSYQNLQKVRLSLSVANVVRDTLIDLFRYEKPKLSLGNDSILCKNYLIDLNLKQDEKALWHDSSTVGLRNINTSNTYSVEVSNNYCSIKDTVKYVVIDCELMSANLCKGDSSKLSFNAAIDSVQWNLGNGSNLTSLKSKVETVYQNEGRFNVKSKIFIDSLILEIENKIEVGSYPVSNFSGDTLVCKGFAFYPIDVANNYQYLWNDGSTAKFIKPQINDLYILKLSNGKCNILDTINILVKDCECPLYVPTAFSPNNDGLNDLLTLVSDCDIADVELRIYTRWGELIHQSKEENANWSGRDTKGLLAPMGGYLWSFSYMITETNIKYVKFGNVFLIP